MLRFASLYRSLLLLAAVATAAAPVSASGQPGNGSPGTPTNPEARKLFAEAVDLQQNHQESNSVDTYLKADKQDGGHCFECLHRAYILAMGIGDFKTARTVVHQGLAEPQSDANRALMRYWQGVTWQREGTHDNDKKDFEESCREFKAALQVDPSLTPAYFSYGISLAHLHRDKAARAQFNAFLSQDTELPSLHPRAQRFAEDVDLARARMAPAFSITTTDSHHVSLDGLAGKVVLIDFWATWCAPCVEALPHLRKIVEEFQGQPFVVLSVSVDEDAAAWKKFVAAHHMTWLQYRNGGPGDSLTALFGVRQIPAAFTIDADGVVQDQHVVGDKQLDDELKNLVAQAVERQNRNPQAASISPQ